MTTNQTIDGVPRERIQQIIADIERGGRLTAVEKLRALLDAPAAPSKFVGAAQYWSENEQALRDVCRFEGLKGLVYQVVRDLDKTAAQPQGVPVAWMYRREGGECLGQLVQMESDSLKDVREGKVVEGYRILWPRDDYIDWKPLYAEQPAPVAVVLPERREIGPNHPYLSDLDIEWNACLDEVTRLNTK